MPIFFVILLLLLPLAANAEVGDGQVILVYPSGKKKKTTDRGMDTVVLNFLKTKRTGTLNTLERNGKLKPILEKKAGGRVVLYLDQKREMSKAEAKRYLVRSFGRYELSMCQDNLKLLARKLEVVYRRQKKYPSKLKAVGKIPKCPSKERDTYSSGYRSDGETYRVTCKGGHTGAGLPKDYPFFDFHRGLVVEPGREYPNKAPKH